MTTGIAAVGTFVVVGAILIAGFAALVRFFYVKVLQGEALINNRTGGVTTVSFTGGLVLPIIHRAEVMDISLKTIELDRRGKDGLICADKIRADIKVTFFIRVNPTEESVLKVAQTIGCQRASDEATLEALFLAKCSEALKTVGYNMSFESLYRERDAFKEAIVREIGTELNGYTIDGAAIDYLEQTKVEDLDPENILDSEGIRSITEITAEKAVETNRLRNDEKKRITKQNVETREAVLALERQQAAAEAGQAREVATIRAKEKAETDRVSAVEHQRAEDARIRANQEIQVAQQNQQREVEVAQKNRERVIAVETERVERERQLEVISRERDVELNRIEKEKALENEKKEIADIIRARIAVDKTVAEEEERIKDLRVTAEAKRDSEARVIAAEAEAQENLVKDIKAAEAAEKAAGYQAKQRLVLAEAELEAADRDARAKIRQAEGDQAQAAASGLAQVKVREADAVALEKEGEAKARVHREQAAAEAEGTEKTGLAAAKVREAQALAAEKEGFAEAKVIEERGFAKARVTEAEAAALLKEGETRAAIIRAEGEAEAVAVLEKMNAEAKGIAEKANAMKLLDGNARGHEEFRLQLEKERTVDLEGIKAQQEIAMAQARTLGTAFANAKIDIVGGDGKFFDRFVGAVGMAKSVDGFVERSSLANKTLEGHLEGDANLLSDIKEVLSRPKLGASDVSQLTLAGFLANLMSETGDDGQRAKLERLAEAAKKLGLDDLGQKPSE